MAVHDAEKGELDEEGETPNEEGEPPDEDVEAQKESQAQVAEKDRLARMLSNLKVPCDCLHLPFQPSLCLCPTILPFLSIQSLIASAL